MKKIKRIGITFLIMLLGTASVFAAELIGEKEAIALASASLGDGIPLSADLEMEGKLVYEVAIFDLGGTIHNIHVNAASGKIEKTRKEKIDKRDADILKGATISRESAIEIATKDVPDYLVIDWELDAENGRPIYSIDFLDNVGIKASADVDAIDGKVVKFEADRVSKLPAISRIAAEQAALATVKGEVLYSRVAHDDGKVYYKVIIISDNLKKHEVNVDGNTGKARIDR